MVRNRAGSHGREWFVVAALAKALACLKPGSGGVQGFKGRPQIHQRPEFENYSAPAKAISRV
jgi:hypothetical protein